MRVCVNKSVLGQNAVGLGSARTHPPTHHFFQQSAMAPRTGAKHATRVLNKYKTADRGQAHAELAHERSYATAGTPPPPPHRARVRGETQMHITLLPTSTQCIVKRISGRRKRLLCRTSALTTCQACDGHSREREGLAVVQGKG
jgi:hypothetical protein